MHDRGFRLPQHKEDTPCNGGGQEVLADRHFSAYTLPSTMQTESVRRAHDAGQVLQRHHSTCRDAQGHVKVLSGGMAWYMRAEGNLKRWMQASASIRSCDCMPSHCTQQPMALPCCPAGLRWHSLIRQLSQGVF